MTTILFLECDRCGQLMMSFEKARVKDLAERHRKSNQEHKLVMHVIEPERSINL